MQQVTLQYLPVPLNQQTNKSLQKVIDDNRKVLHSIVLCIVHCGTHDIALRGKTHETGNMHDLMDFRTEAGDTMVQKHTTDAPQNARYTSHRTQNELIQCCAAVLIGKVITDANASAGFAILADETTDIAGTEQMSLGVRFADSANEETKIRKEFIGFVPLSDRTAAGIAEAILTAWRDFSLNL